MNGQQRNILFAIDHLGYPGGVVHGGGLSTAKLLPHLPHFGYRPTVAVFRDDHPFAETLRADGIDVVFFNRGKWDLRVLTDLVRCARAVNADLLHVRGIKAHFLGRLAGRVLRVPVVMYYNFEYRPRPDLVHRWLAKHTDMVLTVSERLRQQVIRSFYMPADRVEVCYSPVDTDRFSNPEPGSRERLRAELGVDDSQPVIIVVGRVIRHPDKGQHTLIKAMPTVLEEFENAMLVVAGDGADLERCKQIARERGIQSSVKFLGQREDIPELLAMADIAVVPSGHEEAFGRVAVEALSAGKPLVASRAGGLVEVLGNGSRGLLATMGDSEDFAGAICRLIRDPDQAARLAANGVAWAAGLTVERHVRQIVRIYDRILRPGDHTSDHQRNNALEA